jgi:hypothetical protein
LREEGSLDYDGGFVRLQIHINFDAIIYRQQRTLRCDLKTEVDFSCRMKRTLDATTVVDFAPHGVHLRCKKRKALSGKPKQKKLEKMSSFATRAVLRLRLKSACAAGVGLGATISVDLCHWSRLEYLGHGFQTQGTIAARAGLKVRPKSTCVSRPWISDPRYGARVLRVLGPMV